MTIRVNPLDISTAVAVDFPEENAMSTVIFAIASACGIWYFFIVLVQVIGTTQLFRFYSSKPNPAASPSLPPKDVPHITVIRPVKGIEPQLYECLAATFRQTYPIENLTIYLCISSASDPAYAILQRLLKDFHTFDAKVLIEEEDPNLSGHGKTNNLGPNPKIRNMSRAYRETKGDVVWVIDCNVWVGQGVAGRMVDKLFGYTPSDKRATPYKFVHLLPLVVDSVGASVGEESRGLLTGPNEDHQVSSTGSSAYDISPVPKNETRFGKILRTGGGRLEEMFMAGSHAKFYTAINTVGVAPCIVGKSTMFRKSHLDHLTSDSFPYSPGIDYFSENICEDHLIGDLLWRKKVPEEKAGQKFHKHGLVLGDLAIQPMAGMSVQEYIARRVRWLRVRKWTVIVATAVEPGVEPILCSSYGAFAITTLPWFHERLHIPQTWSAFSLFWLASVLAWMTLDSFVYAKIHSGSSVELDTNTPSFAKPRIVRGRRPLGEWILAWIGREFLALPIWSWACLGGTTVMWRGKQFRVGMNMKVIELPSKKRGIATPEVESGRSASKDRQD